jgi:hypothetical protein
MVGRLDEELADGIDEMLVAVVTHNSGDLGEVILRLGSAPPATPRDQLRADLTDFVADYVGQSIQDMDLSDALTSLLEIIRRYNITLPPPFSLLLRTLVELDGTVRNSASPKCSARFTARWSAAVSRSGASLAGSSTLIATGSGWWRLYRATLATCSSEFATAPSPFTSIFAISTRSSTAWCSA